jgi:phospholipid transport system substrate-binding protein
MFRHTLLPALSALVVFHATPSHLQAKPASPQAVLDQALQDLIRVAEASRGVSAVQLSQKTRPVLEKLFNFESLTKRAVGQGWRELSPDQQKQAVALFSEILIRSYASRFDWDSKLEIQFSQPVDLGGGRVEVLAMTRYGNNNVKVLYRMEPAANGWAVYDVVIEGVSLAANYRAQFDSIRQRGGGEALLKLMQENLKQSANKPA